MPALLTTIAQGLVVLLLPGLLGLVPSQGAMRTVTLGHAPMASIINAVIAAGGGIVSARADGVLVVSGRRDRIVQALIPLGVMALPTTAAGCSTAGEG